jgi:hypothetical protein
LGSERRQEGGVDEAPICSVLASSVEGGPSPVLVAIERTGRPPLLFQVRFLKASRKELLKQKLLI